jgi:hypothetical protein
VRPVDVPPGTRTVSDQEPRSLCRPPGRRSAGRLGSNGGVFFGQREAALTSACRPAIAYSRVDTGWTPSAVPSSSNFPASHLGSTLGLIAQSYRTFSSPPLGDLRDCPRPGSLLPPSPPAKKATARQDQTGPSWHSFTQSGRWVTRFSRHSRQRQRFGDLAVDHSSYFTLIGPTQQRHHC